MRSGSIEYCPNRGSERVCGPLAGGGPDTGGKANVQGAGCGWGNIRFPGCGCEALDARPAARETHDVQRGQLRPGCNIVNKPTIQGRVSGVKKTRLASLALARQVTFTSNISQTQHELKQGVSKVMPGMFQSWGEFGKFLYGLWPFWAFLFCAIVVMVSWMNA